MQDILLEQQFYSKKFYFSYSGLNKLLFSPTVFYKHYILNQQEDRTDAHLIEGKLLHCLLLDEVNFDNQFVIMPGAVPSGPTKIILDTVYRNAVAANADLDLVKLHDPILQSMVDANFHQRLKTDQQRLDKIITDDNISYFQFLSAKKNRDIIDQETLDKVKGYIEVITSNLEIMNTLKGGLLDLTTSSEYKSEVKYEADLQGYPFGIKGIIDRVVDHVDHIHIIDLKTTNKTLSEFKETIEYYNYWLQAAMYKKLVSCYDKRPIIFSFVVIDKYQQVYEFEVSVDTMNDWSRRLEEKLKVAQYHYDNRNYQLPYEFATSKIIL
jgi:hypothetical protein